MVDGLRTLAADLDMPASTPQKLVDWYRQQERAYQGWLAGPDGIRHRFGAARRTRTEIADHRIAATVGPLSG